MPNRDAIIEKIKALLSKTTANGCTEGEMLSALDKASAMMDAYDITDEEIQLTKEEKVMLHADPPDLKDTHGIKWRLCYYIGQYCNVQIYRSRGETGLKIIGLPSDVQFAQWLIDTLADFVFNELYAHLIECLAQGRERRTVIVSFVDACCTHIGDRLLELVERSKAARTSNGRELVLVKDTAIKAFMKDHEIRLRTCSRSAAANVSESARRAGHAAGDRASFGRPVSGAGGALRLK